MNDLLYVINTDSDSLSLIDSDKGDLLNTIEVGSMPRSEMAISKDKKYVYVCNCGEDTISKIDLLKNEEVKRIKVGNRPRGIVIINNCAYVALSGSDKIVIVDLSSENIIKDIIVDKNPRVLSSSFENEIFVTCEAKNSLYVISKSDFKIKKVVNVWPTPRVFKIVESIRRIENAGFTSDKGFSIDFMNVLTTVDLDSKKVLGYKKTGDLAVLQF